jgi:hypothetical protein
MTVRIRSVEYTRRLVNVYLKTEETSPLILNGWFKRRAKVFNLSVYSMEEIVLKVLSLTEQYPTETRDGRDYVSEKSNRSCVDIWRLIINFIPEVTIFQVMNSIYKIKDKLNCQYCFSIEKRVFYVNSIRNSLNIILPSSFVHHSEKKDEFGLYFEEWGRILEGHS